MTKQDISSTDAAELRTVLMLAHAHLHQFVPLGHNKADQTRALQRRLQDAWERLSPPQG